MPTRRAWRRFAAVLVAAPSAAAALTSGCSAGSGADTIRVRSDASVPDATAPLPPPGDASPRDAPAVVVRDASSHEIADSSVGASGDAKTGAPPDGLDGTLRDATSIADATPETAPPDGPAEPDCTCPTLGFFLDAAYGATALHLTAPYTLSIYCEETAVQLGHPRCGEVYRLSACNGANDAPPCFYMGVDLSRGLLLGNFVDADSKDWDVIEGTIAPDAPMGRVGTGTFSATIRIRGGTDTATLSGSFNACLTRMPACQ